MAETETSKPIDRQPGGLSRWTPSLPTNLMSVLNPFSSDDSDKTDAETAHASNKRASIFSSILPANPSTTATPPAPSDDDESTMFAEPETRSNSDEGSREGSVAESGRRKSKMIGRPKTCYSICHPPPTSTTRQRLHRRPRSLMQLHKLSPNSRPQPAFEIIPSANFSVKMTKGTTKVFKAKHGLCPNDLVVLKAERYSACELDEEQEARDIIARICKGRKDDGQAAGKAKICFPDGREWEAYPTPNSGYEFFTTDEHGLGITLRWVPKRNKDGSKPSADSANRKFNFSTISPNSRRHPVIATLSKTSLDINDTFKIPEASAATPLSTPLQSSTILAQTMEEDGCGKDLCETDERLREIITMTGIWVAFKEGWSPFFKCDDKEKDAMFLQRSPSLRTSPSPSKAATFAISPVSSPPGSPAPGSPGLGRRTSIKSVGGTPRKGGLFGRTSRVSTTSLPEPPDTPTSPSSAKKTGRTRADSTSTVLVHRAANNRVKNQQASWRVEMLASQHEMREQPSTEDLARSQSDGDIATSPTPQKGESIARPILPSASNSGASAREIKGVATTSPTRRRKSPQEEQRRSVSETTSSASEASKKPQKVVKQKRSVWRRLLCGS